MEGTVKEFLRLPIAEPLLAWYAQNARKLPWRETRDPYRIWVSEIMLQQTRVEAVKGYYTRFLAELDTVEALAAVDEARLMKLWEGLGYYSRARNLARAAKRIVAEFGGKLPADVAALRSLPGIGAYTAGAIASIAFDIPAPAVDGNVLRVLSRLSACRRDIAHPHTKALAEEAALDMMGSCSPGVFNQALMELGALLCLPNRQPLCEECPLAALCRGRREGVAATLPVKSKKAPRRIEEKTVLLLRNSGSFYIRRRQDKGLLAGLYELPNLEGMLDEVSMTSALDGWGLRICGEAIRYHKNHIFTHVEWRMRVYALSVQRSGPPPAGWLLYGKEEHALPTAFQKCLL